MLAPTGNPPTTNLFTVEAAQKAINAFLKIAHAWELTLDQQSVLLGSSGVLSDLWRNGKVEAPLSPEMLQRLGYIFSIYAALHTLLPVQERADAWIRQPNAAQPFGGGTALDRMLRGSSDDLKAVADYLEAQ